MKIGEVKSIVVYAHKELNPTGILLSAGEVYRINPSEPKGWKDFMIPTDLEGITSFWMFIFATPRIANKGYLALCASVGSDEKELVYIGLGNTIEVRRSGELFLFANDLKRKWAYRNNKGEVAVSIQRLK